MIIVSRIKNVKEFKTIFKSNYEMSFGKTNINNIFMYNIFRDENSTILDCFLLSCKFILIDFNIQEKCLKSDFPL